MLLVILQQWFLLGLLVIAWPAWPEPAVESDPVMLSRFSRTIYSLQQSQPAQVADFAVHALAQLAEVYMAEADLARMEALPEEVNGRVKLLGWSQAVDQYANQLMLLLDDIAQGAAVEIHQSRKRTVTVKVDGRAVILGHPRPDQQAAYEQRVLADFCARNDCKSLTAQVDQPQPIPMSASRVKPVWTFTGNGQLCSYDGIELRFNSTRNLGLMRSVCEELMQELSTMAIEIAWQQRHGADVHWSTLQVNATPGRPEHLVQLNSAGDSILVTIPLLFGSPGLIDSIKPWLQSKVAGGKPAAVRLDAASYGWVEPQ